MISISTIKLALLATSLGAFLALGAWLYHQGGRAQRITIERQNNAAANQSDDARRRFDLCADAGFVWDFRTGRCLGSSPADRR